MHNQKKDNKNLKTKNNQNCQKIELYGSLTTKEIKKKHLSRPETFIQRGRDGQLSREDSRQGGGWRTRASKTMAGGPRKAADCGEGQARLWLAGKAATGGPSDRVHNSGL